jgi:hypothetical protein
MVDLELLGNLPGDDPISMCIDEERHPYILIETVMQMEPESEHWFRNLKERVLEQVHKDHPGWLSLSPHATPSLQ